MDEEIPDHRLTALLQALDQVLQSSASGRRTLKRERPHRRKKGDAPELHTARVMQAVYAEAARQDDLEAPLAGALTYYELRARTRLSEWNLGIALCTLISYERRLRTRDEGTGRIYFLPARERTRLRNEKLERRAAA